ncbi:integrase/recombinase xerD homolog [Lissotriton helveticus]
MAWRERPAQLPLLNPVGEIPWASLGGGQDADPHAGTSVDCRRDRVLQLVVGSLAVSTRTAYELAWKEFLESGAGWRAPGWRRSEDVVQFILHLIDRGLTRVTIAGKLAGIAFMGKLLWGYSPSAGEVGKRMLEGWSRERGREHMVRRPLSWQTLARVLQVLPSVCLNGFEVCLFSTLMVWMFFGAFRVSELLGSKVTFGVGWENVRFLEAGLHIWLARAKTDQHSKGRGIWLEASSPPETCPLGWARRLRDCSGAALEGPVFRHVDGSRVTEYQLRMVLRKALRFLGLDETQYGTHSFRIGAATEAHNRGWSQQDIMSLGRWSSNCFRRYVRTDPVMAPADDSFS